MISKINYAQLLRQYIVVVQRCSERVLADRTTPLSFLFARHWLLLTLSGSRCFDTSMKCFDRVVNSKLGRP